MNAPVLAAVPFWVPPANPSPYGLYPAVNWVDETVPRWLDAGVQFRPINYGELPANNPIGVWAGPWCGQVGSGSAAGAVKWGERPELPDPFLPTVVWAYDACDLTAYSRDEVLMRVQQIHRLGEPVIAEILVGAELVDMVEAAGIGVARDSVRDGLSYLEGQLARTNTLGVVHAAATAASMEWGLVLPQGTSLKTPLGHAWVLAGGYVDTLDGWMIATSPMYGWRTPVNVYPVVDAPTNTFAAIAERSVVVGYEKLVAAVKVDIGSV